MNEGTVFKSRLAIYQALTQLTNEKGLLGVGNDDAIIQVQNWLEWAANVVATELEATNKKSGSPSGLDNTIWTSMQLALTRKTFLAGTINPTMADWSMFALLGGRLRAMTPSIGARYFHVIRWAAYLQYLYKEDNSMFNLQSVQAALDGVMIEVEPKSDAKSKRNDKTQSNDKIKSFTDVSKLHPLARVDLRVGRILNVEKHPHADRLYIEKVDLGDVEPRIVVSGLVEFVSLAELQDRLAVFICNLKPATICKTLSSAMLLVAKINNTIEEGEGTKTILEPLLVPEGSKPGDRISIKGIEPQPDNVIKAKDGIWDTIVKDQLKVIDGVACYGGEPLTVQSIQDSRIKSNQVVNGIIS